MFALFGAALLPGSAPFWGASDYFYNPLPEIPIRFIYGISYGLLSAVGAYLGIYFASQIWPGHKYQAWVYVLAGAVAAGLRYGLWPYERLFFVYLLPALIGGFATFLLRRWKTHKPKSL